MHENCREICVLVRNIVETVSANGRGCQADIAIDSCCEPLPNCRCAGPCDCATFISATAGPCVTLEDAVIEPGRARHGFCLRANLLVPVTAIVRVRGVNQACRGHIRLPVEGVIRGNNYNELVAQASVRIVKGCYQNGCLRLWVDFHAEIHAICHKAVRIPTLGPGGPGCRESCHPFFNLPLYPS